MSLPTLAILLIAVLFVGVLFYSAQILSGD